MKNKWMKLLAAALLIQAGSLTVFASDMSQTRVEKAMRTLEQKIVQTKLSAAASSDKAPVQWIKAQWEVVRTKTFSRRKVSVTTPWGKPHLTETSCRAVNKDNKIYVPASCYYPTREKNREVKWLASQLITPRGDIALAEPDLAANDWVVFDWPIAEQAK